MKYIIEATSLSLACELMDGSSSTILLTLVCGLCWLSRPYFVLTCYCIYMLLHLDCCQQWPGIEHKQKCFWVGGVGTSALPLSLCPLWVFPRMSTLPSIARYEEPKPAKCCTLYIAGDDVMLDSPMTSIAPTATRLSVPTKADCCSESESHHYIRLLHLLINNVWPM